MSTEAEPNGEPTGEAKFKRGIRGKAKFLLYFNHFLIGWDEHIWSFALSLFLVEITPQSLTFIASYGLVAGIAVLLFGTVVGDWVDRTHRLTVARVSVLVQNLALIVCCLVVYVVIEYKNSIAEVLPGQGLLRMCYAIIILIAILSNLTNMARTTAIERDWIVEICDRDADMLADLSATMRRISLVTMVITPIITGQILSRTSHSTGALVVAGWNFMTIFLEYYLLLKIYNEVPQLQRRKVNAPQHAVIEFTHVSGLDTAAPIQELEEEPREAIAMTNEDNTNTTKTYKASRSTENERTFVQTICATFFTFRRGWRVYKNYDVAFAGLALSSLYLTVLGFHHTTVGFAYAQGLSEDLIGGLLATAAFTGIIGTFLYPIVRKAIGLQSTGLYALAAEVTCLTLCVASVFVPGSPFDPGYFSRREPIPEGVITLDTGLLLNQTGSFTGNYPGNASTPSSVTMEPEMTTTSYWSISLLLTGIIAARVGLWMADLTITQLFLESVDVTERGIVAGVQNALNQLMDMLKYAIVILLPVPEVF